MRVLHVDSAGEWRGGQVQLLHLVEAMKEQGLDVGVACPVDSPLWAAVEFLGENRLPIPLGWSFRTARIVRAFGADLVAAHTSHAHTSVAVLRVPLVVHRRVDFVPSGGWKYRRPEAYIAVSSAVAEVLRSVGAEGIHVVHDGVDPLPKARAARGGPEVLAVGARVAHKGHRYLAEAMKALPGVDVGVAGEGPLVYDGPRWLGQRTDVSALMAKAKVFVHPSVEEGMGQVVVEAMLAGVPVVVTDAGGLPEVVGDTGIVVPRADPLALARGIQRALRGDHPPVDAARARALQRFSVGQMVEGTIKVYGSLL